MTSPTTFVGRVEELDTLKALMTRARNGVGGALVVRGEPGIGKTALLDAATTHAGDAAVIRSDGFEAELAMPYAALQRIASPLTDHLERLPARQQQALRVAAGQDDGPPPDRFLVGLGMLGLFAAASGQRPVLCVVDDAHWLDSESREVLAFVARRLQAESTVLLFGARDSAESQIQLAGIPVLELGGLDAQSAVRLLAASAAEPIDPYAATRIATATGGNPLALLDLTQDLRPHQLSRLWLSSAPAPIGSQLEEHYLHRIRKLPHDIRLWLSLAAAEPSAQQMLIATAAAALDLSPDCRIEAERARLVTAGETIAFRHPLVRSAVYGAMTGSDRRRVHAALRTAAATLGLADLEAWHAAEAAEGPDPVVADRLAAVADRAARRGGLVSQARLLIRAADLTPPGAGRDDLLLAAARAAADAGAAQLAQDLVDRISADGLDAVAHGRLIMIRTELALFLADSALVVRGPADLLSAAALFHDRAPELEQAALLRAFELWSVTELQMEGLTLDELGRRIGAGADVLPGPRSVVLHALAAHILDPYPDAVPLMRTALDMLGELDDATVTDFGFVGITIATALFEKDAGGRYLDRLAAIARDAGALRALDTVLWVRSIFELEHGEPAACGASIRQVRELRRAIGYDAENVVNAGYLAWTGMSRDELELVAQAVKEMGFGGVHTSAVSAIALSDIAEGRYHDAYTALRTVVDAPLLQVAYVRFADFVEAATRSGHDADARRVAARITMMAAASGTVALHSQDHRCQALLAADDEAEDQYRQALGLLEQAHLPADLARTHLLYGEWLRRMKRRRDARDQLRSAIALFDRLEAPAFADRARAELAATGERSTGRKLVGGVELSPQEASVARMAADGHTNAEIGATLFISSNTVDYHLRKVFAKVGVSSRRQLAERFGADG
ncbi:LuxR family transcriptional regulator [Mycobacterium sp. shizuoka-1]|uniref:helix-turn-helix transcriptional regulator n=1 Tax=Mycobacterium sp. shizuoka-1 TaxID=2039281 RepID=UPI000C063E19|nr:LuxR family transcriptional regulator [Mycobacterium sp. shizuoka-1]GAY14009.1 transcriptional regulator [Mycobacterium sp. shizuoka-1]